MDAEKEILRLMLTGLCKELDVFGIITNPEVFYDPKHQVVFTAMLEAHKQSNPSTFISVLDILQNNGQLNRIGGKAYLVGLTNSDDNYLRGEDIEKCARLLVEKWVRRELIKASSSISGLGFNQCKPLEAALDEAERLVYALRNLTPNRTTLHNADVANMTYEQLNNPNQIYSTGYPALDSLLVGLEAQTLTVLAARSSMGKTSFAVQTLMQMALLHDKHCAYFSLEMTAEQLEHRLWCLISNHPHYAEYKLTPLKASRIREHLSGISPFSDEEKGNLAAIASLSTHLNFSINDSRNITPTGIGSECRKLKSQHDNELGLVIIDYLQLFGGEGSNAAETSNRLLGVTRYFYNLAQELKCPIVLLAQINRGPEGKQDKRPNMSDLAQSGGVEWVADNILMLYREGYYSTENPDDPTLEVICRKARQGATGTAKMCFDKERMLVYEADFDY
jgi:replicative DNA helicase